MKKLPVINFNVLSVKYIYEISLPETLPSEIMITFKCCSPVNETDTFATINRHFDDGMDFSYETAISEEGFIFTGSLRMCEPDCIENIREGEFIVPLSVTLVTLLQHGTYDQLCAPESIMAEAWFGERCETVTVSWVSS